MKKETPANIRHVKTGMEDALAFLTPQRITEIALANEKDLIAKGKNPELQNDEGDLICIL
ncbi:hypothetical protein V8J88_16030 [Massilia sp. W12]|uniref:hypothetical protein n=1 Tax=Massilia sp. W12 TaxID=3126507 RepID=UPI0030CC6C57